MPQHFIVRHDLKSFRAMPGFIWRINKPKDEIPRGFRRVEKGDRWIEFAYIEDEIGYEPCSLVVGFYECTEPRWYGRIPLSEGKLKEYYGGARGSRMAHMIEGRKCDGYQPKHAVSVPPIREILGKNIMPRVAVAPIDPEDFRKIREEARKREFDPNHVPLLKREPRNEQEVLSVVVFGHQKLGIEKIVRVQTRFPDLLVKVSGKEVYVELEFDSLGFWKHIEEHQLRKSGSKLAAKIRNRDDDKPVAVLCWVDGDRKHQLRKRVPDLRVFELQSLLRDGKKIDWP